jgi:hypothetical protein
MTTSGSSSGQLKYQWSRINKEGEEKFEDDECVKNSDSKTLVIDGFEGRYAGTYRCVISALNQPIVSTSAEVELDLPGVYIQKLKNTVYCNNIILQNIIFYAECPEDFSTEMSTREFLLFVNTNGIRYKVCKKLKGIQRDNCNAHGVIITVM